MVTARETHIEGVIELVPAVYGDRRGSFSESWNKQNYSELLGSQYAFVQDNQSVSYKNVIRGLHYQLRRPQGKLVRVVQGCVLDVAVDLRLSSPTFGQHCVVELSSESGNQLWLPPGMAHGFSVKSKVAILLYKTTEYYYPEDEYTICWNDKDLCIEWHVSEGEAVLSKKDSTALSFATAPYYE